MLAVRRETQLLWVTRELADVRSIRRRASALRAREGMTVDARLAVYHLKPLDHSTVAEPTVKRLAAERTIRARRLVLALRRNRLVTAD